MKDLQNSRKCTELEARTAKKAPLHSHKTEDTKIQSLINEIRKIHETPSQTWLNRQFHYFLGYQKNRGL
jgi:hypothetical protein